MHTLNIYNPACICANLHMMDKCRKQFGSSDSSTLHVIHVKKSAQAFVHVLSANLFPESLICLGSCKQAVAQYCGEITYSLHQYHLLCLPFSCFGLASEIIYYHPQIVKVSTCIW